jgi:hypothetical protein
MIVKEINLLTIEEFEKYKDLIPALRIHGVAQHYWLRPTNDAERPFWIADSEHSLDWNFPSSYEYIRPSLRISENNTTTKIGDKIHLFGESWTVLDSNNDEMLVLCDDYIAYRDMTDYTSNWDFCDLKKWLNDWLLEMQKVNNEKKYKRLKFKRKANIKIKGSYFYNYFPKVLIREMPPVFILFFIIGVLCYFFPTLHPFLNSFVLAFFVLCTFFRFFNALINVLSPHPDTTLRAFLNIALSVTGFILLYMNVEDFVLRITLQLILFFISTLIFRYLQAIKYYS